jgi:hypothetical protein
MGTRVGKIHIGDIALGVIALVLVVYVSLPLIQDHRAPVIYRDAYYDGDEYPGADGVIWYYGERVRSCESRVVDHWILPNGERITVFDDTGNWTNIGEFKVPVAVTIPDAGPGLYIYRSRVTNYCADGVHNKYNPPDVLVVVPQ